MVVGGRGEPLRAGTGRSDITPPDGYPRPHWGGQTLPSRGFVRPLLATATVFRQGGKSLALASLDLCAIRAPLVDRIRDRLAQSWKEPFHLVVNCSHSHEAPFLADDSPDPRVRAYEEDLVGSVCGAVGEARNAAQEARIFFHSAPLRGFNRNRRRPRSAVDRNLSLLRVDGVGGGPLALLWHFTAHPLTNLGLERAWSPDFPGIANEILERRFEGCRAQYLQGALGDVFPLDWHFRQRRHRYPTDETTERWMGERLAAALVDRVPLAEPLAVSGLGWARDEIELPGRPIAWTLEEIERRLAELRGQVDERRFVSWSGSDHAVNVAQRHAPRYQLLALRSIRKMKLEENTFHRCPLSALGLGSLAMVTIPGEPFSREGLILRRATTPLPCLVLGCSDGYLSYIPSLREARQVERWDLDQFIDQKRNRWAYGATITTFLAGDSANRIVDRLAQLLRQLPAYQNVQ